MKISPKIIATNPRVSWSNHYRIKEWKITRPWHSQLKRRFGWLDRMTKEGYQTIVTTHSQSRIHPSISNWVRKNSNNGNRSKRSTSFFMVLQKVINPKGIMEINYARGLGIASNNQVDAYGFLQGLKNIDFKRVQSILFVGDSSTILKLMNKHHISTINSLAWIISQIKIKVSHFKDIEYFHIIWGMNG